MDRTGMWCRVIGFVLLVAGVRPALAQNQIALDEVLGSWEGDDSVQFVELRLLADGQTQLTAGAALVFDDETGSSDKRKFLFLDHNIANGLTGANVLIATQGLTDLSGVTPDFVLAPGMLAPRNGRVCYAVTVTGGLNPVDCVSYGTFMGDQLSFGPPTPITPDDRSIERVQSTGRTLDDWQGTVQPTPQNNAGDTQTLATRCGDGLVSQGEQCDGTALLGATCASLGFARGTLACTQCHYDVSGCTACGNGAINDDEECDGSDFGGKSCESLGFTGGALRCTDTCRISTRNCDPTFFVAGGGPRGPECLAEWLVTNATNRPGSDGRAPIRQRCKDGDSGCDSDAVDGACTFTVAVCFDHQDARLARGLTPCRVAPIESWSLVKPPPDAAGDLAPLVAAVGAVGPSTTDGATVSFAPALTADERCSAPAGVTVPRHGQRAGVRLLRARITAAGGRPRDLDALKLVCQP